MTGSDDRLSMADIAELAGITYKTVQAHRALGTLPPPDHHPSPRVIQWNRATIDTWLAARAERRRP